MPSFRLEHEIVNNSTYNDLIVAHKGGLKYVIRKKDEPSFDKTQYIAVKLHAVVLKQLHLDPSKALTKLDKEIMDKLLEEADKLKNSETTYFPTLEDTVLARVELNQRHAEDNGAIHSELLGLTMYSGSGNIHKEALNVPTSTLSQAIDQLYRSNPRNAVHYCAYVVDPRRTQNPLYVNIAGRATEVPASIDEQARAGLYIGISVGEKPPETIFYEFDSLSKDMLESLGIFPSKAEAMKNGNTERYLEAEKKAENLSKELDSKIKLLRDTTSRLEKAEKAVEGYELQVTNIKQNHLMELARLNQERKSLEEKYSRNDYDSKQELNRIKEELHRRSENSKNTIEQMKQRSKWAFAVDALKGLANLVPLLTFGMRFLT